MKYDVLIIGAGSTGASLARRLSRFQLKVAMLEKENDVAMGTGKANTAIVHGGYAESGKELRGRLCLPGRKKLEKLNDELHFGLRTNGSLVLAFEEEELPALKQLYQQGLENGLTDMELVGREKLRELEPAVHPDAKYALYCSGAGILSPYEYIIALCENAVYNGVRLFLNTEVTGIMGDRDQGFQIQALQGGKKVAFESSFVVNAAGLAGAGVTNMVQEADFTIHPRSGQFLLFQKGTGSRIHHSLFQVPTPKTKGILVAQTYHNNMLLGPDAVDEKEARWDTDIDRLLAIYHGAQRSVQKGIIPEKQLIRTFTGMRPSPPWEILLLERPGFSAFCKPWAFNPRDSLPVPSSGRCWRTFSGKKGWKPRKILIIIPSENPSFNTRSWRISTRLGTAWTFPWEIPIVSSAAANRWMRKPSGTVCIEVSPPPR